MEKTWANSLLIQMAFHRIFKKRRIIMQNYTAECRMQNAECCKIRHIYIHLNKSYRIASTMAEKFNAIALLQSFIVEMPIQWEERKFRELYGVSEVTVMNLWSLISQHNDLQYSHLLWMLFFIKTYNTTTMCAKYWKVDPKTYCYWVWKAISIVSQSYTVIWQLIFLRIVVQLQ